MLDEATFCDWLNAGKSVDFFGAFGETGMEFVDHTGIGGLCAGQLEALHVLQIANGFLENVGLFEFRVAGRLIGEQTYTCPYIVSIVVSKSKHPFHTIRLLSSLDVILTSFLVASRMRAFSSFRQLLMRARRRFSMIGLLLCAISG